MTLAPPMEDIEVLVFGDPDEPILCESTFCQDVGRGVHEAELWAQLPCSFMYRICRSREYDYASQKELRCSSHCGQMVKVEGIRTWPL